MLAFKWAQAGNSRSGRKSINCANTVRPAFMAIALVGENGRQSTGKIQIDSAGFDGQLTDQLRVTANCELNVRTALFGNKGLNVPRVLVLGSSPLEMSAFTLNRGLSGRFGNRQPVSEATVHARILAEPKLPNCQGAS